MIGLEETCHILIDALLLLKQLPLVETAMDTTTSAAISTTLANVKTWMNTF